MDDQFKKELTGIINQLFEEKFIRLFNQGFEEEVMPNLDQIYPKLDKIEFRMDNIERKLDRLAADSLDLKVNYDKCISLLESKAA